MQIPSFETDRLRLVAPAEAHLDAFYAMYSDDETTRHVPHTRVSSTTAAWFKIATQLGHWQLRGCGFWTVEEKASGQVVGNVGLLHPAGNPALEVGWLTAKPYWGRGYGSEAARVALDFAFETLAVQRVIARLSAANPASLAVAYKLGMVQDESASVEDELVLFIERPTL